MARLIERIQRALAPMDEPGPEVAISPFRPGEVTGEGVAVKALAALVGGRRAAANARDRRIERESSRRYRDALTAQLERKVSPEMVEADIPGLGRMQVTREQLLKYGRDPKVTGAGSRLSISPEAAKRFNIPLDPDGMVSTANFNAGMKMWAADALTRQRDRAATTSKERYDTAREEGAWSKLLEGLGKEEEVGASAAEAAALEEATTAKRIVMGLTGPATPKLRHQAASLLGLGPALNPNTGEQLLQPGTNFPMYDTSKIDDMVKGYAARKKAEKLTELQAKHASDRLYYSQRQREARGGPNTPQGEAPDPVLDEIRLLVEIFGGGAGVPSDEPSGRDLQNIPDDEPIGD